MGTNYYHRTMICECCGRYDQAHICKSFVSFHGYPDNPVPIVSWQDWKRAILTPRTYVYDEYGIQLPTEEFIRRVEATNPAARRRQFDEICANWPEYRGDYWLDPDEFTFSWTEFM